MERRKVLEILGEGGNIVFEEITLEKQEFYTIRTSENIYAEKGLNRDTLSPLYNSFQQALEYCEYPIFALHPEYIDPTIWNELSDAYVNYCEAEGKEVTDHSGWAKALEIKSLAPVIDVFEELGVPEEKALKITEIFVGIHLDESRQKEIEAILNDPFAFEGGGPGTRELLLLLAKDIQG